MTTTTEGQPSVSQNPEPAADDRDRRGAYHEHVAALTAAYHCTVDAIMVDALRGPHGGGCSEPGWVSQDPRRRRP